MKFEIKDDRFIVIAPRKYYRDLICFFQTNHLVNFKFYTKEEILSNYYGSYDIDAVIYTMNKFDISYSNAKMLLANINVDNIVDNEKISRLINLQEELNSKKLLHKNIYISNELQSKPIYMLGYGNSDKELNKIFRELNLKVNYIDFERGNYIPNVLEFGTIDEEIFYVFNSICDLIISGVKQSDIVLIADKQKYAYAINKMCQQYNLPKLMTTTTSIISLPNVLNIVKQIEMMGLSEFLYHNEFSDDEYVNLIKNIIVDNKITTINKIDKQLDALKAILKNINKQELGTEFITTQDDLSIPFDNKYYFILGFNQGVFPVIEKDDDYLMNKEKDALGLSTSFDVNHVNKWTIIDALTNLKHGFISYPISNSGEKLYPSSLINELNMNVDKLNSKTIYSSKEGEKVLAKLEDLKRKFDVDSDERHSYKKMFDIAYMTYDHKFTNIANYHGKDFRNYSYSNIKTFFQCGFRYYLLNILHLDDYEETFAQRLGLLCHEVLTRVYDSNFDFEKSYQEAYEKFNFNNKEAIILIRKKEELAILCNILVEHKSSINLKDVHLEEKFIIKLNDNVSINGMIDKILVTSDGSKDYYSIIDYKTGSETFNKKEVPYGFSMQLPTYALLLSENEKFKDKELIGIYIQKIISDAIGIPEDSFSFYRNKFRLTGESINDLEKMKTFDSTCASSIYVKSYSVTKDGTFNKNARVNSKKDFDELIEKTKENYLNADEKIQNGLFTINPTTVGNEQNIPCRFCSFKDICNVKAKDYVFISIKGEDENGVDE